MSCNLNRFSTYAIAQVVQDDADGKVLVQLVDPPKSCPDRAFSTHKGMIVVNAGAQPSLSWSNTANRPVITVPRRDAIQHVEHPGHVETRPERMTVHVPDNSNAMINGMLINEMMHAYRHNDHVVREAVPPPIPYTPPPTPSYDPTPRYTPPTPGTYEPSSSYSSPSDDTSSDGWGSSFSSDSSDSFGSDLSSSSDTSFSSDSGSTFGSD